MKKVMVGMTVLMGFTMSLVLSLVGTLMGGHFTIPSWAMSFGLSFVISLVIGFVIPVKKLGDGFCKNCKVNPETMKGNLISALVSDLIYTPIITIIMVVVMLGNAAKHIVPNGAEKPPVIPPIGKVLVPSLVVCLLVGYAVIVIVQPLFIRILTKNIKK